MRSKEINNKALETCQNPCPYGFINLDFNKQSSTYVQLMTTEPQLITFLMSNLK